VLRVGAEEEGVALTVLRDGAEEGVALTVLRDGAEEAGVAFTVLRDGAEEAGVAFTVLRDGAEEAGVALTVLRDGAEEAGVALTVLRVGAEEAGVAGAVLGVAVEEVGVGVAVLGVGTEEVGVDVEDVFGPAASLDLASDWLFVDEAGGSRIISAAALGRVSALRSVRSCNLHHLRNAILGGSIFPKRRVNDCEDKITRMLGVECRVAIVRMVLRCECG
jgi:hypothetical protein